MSTKKTMEELISDLRAAKLKWRRGGVQTAWPNIGRKES